MGTILSEKFRVVWARGAIGLNQSLHPSGPKYTIRCGACPATFRNRVLVVDYPTTRCPNCGTWNKLNLVVHEDD